MANKKEVLNVQPHSIDAEQAVLGSMLTDKDAVNKAFEKKLLSEHFYKKSHSLIFAAMEVLDKKSEPIDTISVVDILTKNNDIEAVGGAFYVSGLVELVPTTAHVARYIKIVIEKSILRDLIFLANDISKEAFDDRQDVDDILESVQRSIFSITQDGFKKDLKKLTQYFIKL